MNDGILVRAITAGKGQILRAFLRAWERGGSNGLALRVVCSEEEAGALRETAQASYDVETHDGAWADVGEAFREEEWGIHKLGWASKVAILRRAAFHLMPGEVLVWLDHDCEARGNLRELAEEFAESGCSMGAPLYSTMGTGRFPKTRAGQNGLFLLRREAYEDIAKWWGVMVRENMPNDEAGFVLAFGGGGFGEVQVRRAEQKLWDVMKGKRKWYASCDCFEEIRVGGVRMATARLLKDKEATVRHWCAGVGKKTFCGLYDAGESEAKEKATLRKRGKVALQGAKRPGG